MTIHELREHLTLAVQAHAEFFAKFERGDFTPEDAMKASVFTLGAVIAVTDYVLRRDEAVKAQLDGFM